MAERVRQPIDPAFIGHYRQHATAQLRKHARFLALLVVVGDRDFHWSVAELKGEALRFGAELLPPREYRRLMEWIPRYLLRAVTDVTPQWDGAQARAKVAAIEFQQWERARWQR